MPWRKLLADPPAETERLEARRTWRALRDLALMAEKATGARAVALTLVPKQARDLGLGDCLIGPEDQLDRLLPVARALQQGFAPEARFDAPPSSHPPLVTDRRAPDGAPLVARALFLKDGSCAGVLALHLAPHFALPPGSLGGARHSDAGAVAGLGEVSHALDLLGTIAETLLNDRLRKLEVQRGLVACRSEMNTLRQISERDPLTGLANIATFEAQVRALLHGPGQQALLVLLDIDHFKAINDLYGHQFGDLCLKTVARAVRAAAPAGAVAARLGGDEFGLALPLSGPAGDEMLRDILTDLSHAILQATAPLDKPGLGKVSIGAARFPGDAADYDRLYNRADLALYASKSLGRGAVTLYSADIGERYDYTELAKNFSAACRAGQVVPYFQPMVDLKTGQPRVYEVLCRWNNPRHGLMAPEAFSSIFSDHEFATHLTRHMARESIRIFGPLRPDLGRGVKLSLNLTYFDLMDRDFVFDLQAMLSRHGVPWTQLVVEVQETVAMDRDGGQVFRSLSEMRRLGAEIALDDYGTGFAALKHLRNWPVDMLKIDRSFVDGICSSGRDRAIVRSILQLSQDLGLRVVAEGVERADQAAMLADMGCDMGQGYGLGRPMDPHNLTLAAGGGPPALGPAPIHDPAPRDEVSPQLD